MPGFTEMIVILAEALLIFGPDKMPDIGRGIGKALRELRNVKDDLMGEIDLGLDDDLPKRRR